MKTSNTNQTLSGNAPLPTSVRAALGPGFQISCPAGLVLNAAANDYRRTSPGVRF